MLWAILIVTVLMSLSLQYLYPDKADLRRAVRELRDENEIMRREIFDAGEKVRDLTAAITDLRLGLTVDRLGCNFPQQDFDDQR
jgi:hypothetical protein